MFSHIAIPIYCYLIAFVLALVLWLWKRNWRLALLIAYMFLIFTQTVLIRESEDLRYKTIPFWSWKEDNLRSEIVANVIVFVPIGLVMGNKGWKGIAFALGFSASIEIIQLITHRGLFEFDDIIHNTIGSVLGLGIYTLVKRVKKNDV